MAIRLHPREVAGELRARDRQGHATVKRAMHMAAMRGRTHLVSRTPVDRGMMKNAWRVHKGSDLATGRTGSIVINDAPYAGIIEKGSRPHPVSREGVEAIRGWVLRNITFTTTLQSGKNKGKQSKPRRHGEDDPIVDQITWGIVRNINKFGSRATYFVRNEIPELTRFFQEAVLREIKRQAYQRAGRGGKGK